MKDRKQWEWKDIAVGLIMVGVFGFFLIHFPIIRAGDSFQHESGFITREPAYALIIKGLRAIFGEETYRLILIILQNIFAGVCSFVFVRFFRRTWKLGWFATLAITGVTLLPYLMTPLFSATNVVITNSIMTEAVAMPLFLLFAVEMLQMLWQKQQRRKHAVISLIMAFVLSNIRGQLMTLFLVWMITLGYLTIKDGGKKLKSLVIIVLCVAACFVTRSTLIKVYNYCQWGIYTNTASGGAMAVANVLYVAEREDGEGIADEGVRNLFYDVYDSMEEAGINYHYAKPGLLNRAEHHEDTHEAINFDHFTDKTKDYIRDTTGVYVDQYMQLMVDVDGVASQMMKGLLPRCFGRYLYNYMAIILYGFIRSVAVVNPILNWYTLVFYLVSALLTVVLLRQNRNSKSAHFMMLSLLMVCGNVFATSFVIECISRYMFYTFPLLYTAALLMVIELWRDAKNKKEKK